MNTPPFTELEIKEMTRYVDGIMDGVYYARPDALDWLEDEWISYRGDIDINLYYTDDEDSGDRLWGCDAYRVVGGGTRTDNGIKLPIRDKSS